MIGRRLVLRVVLALVVLYLLYVGVMFAFQRRILFPEWQAPDVEVDGALFGYERIDVDGHIEAWFLPSGVEDASPMVVYGHGNAELADQWFENMSRYAELGVGVLIVEYPGYGGAEGDPSEASIERALELAYDVVVERSDVDRSRIVAHGRSIGGWAVGTLMASRPVHAAILESTFTDLSDMTWRYLLPAFLILDDFDTLAVVREFDGPILVMHGNEDTLIPISHGRELAEAARDGRFVELACDHNTCLENEVRYWSAVEGFLMDSGISAGDETTER